MTMKVWFFFSFLWVISIAPKSVLVSVNTLRPRQYGHHFADDAFNRIFVNENVRISIKFSLKFVPKSPINNNPALFQIMASHHPGDKPLSEPMMVSSLTHICVTRPQLVKGLVSTAHPPSKMGKCELLSPPFPYPRGIKFSFYDFI